MNIRFFNTQLKNVIHSIDEAAITKYGVPSIFSKRRDGSLARICEEIKNAL